MGAVSAGADDAPGCCGMSTDRVILLAAGGTGGHLFPAEALANALIARGYTIELATDERAVRYVARISRHGWSTRSRRRRRPAVRSAPAHRPD